MISDNIFGMKSAHKHAPSRAHVISLCFCGNIWWRVSSYFSAVCLNDQQTPGNYNIIIFPRLHIGYALASLGGNHQRVQGDRVVSWDCGNVCERWKKTVCVWRVFRICVVACYCWRLEMVFLTAAMFLPFPFTPIVPLFPRCKLRWWLTLNESMTNGQERNIHCCEKINKEPLEKHSENNFFFLFYWP